MSNHTHFLVYDEGENLPIMMHKLGIAYATYYNRKYKHSGHVFQSRFKSIIIENERQFMLTCKYILYNPEKAGICNHSIYQWSSFSEYHTVTDFPDTEIIYKFFPNEQIFYEFLSSSDDESMEYEKFEECNADRKDDQWAEEILCNLLHVDSGISLQNLSKNKRDATLRRLKKEGLGVRQIERLTGISRSVIQRA